ncbi:MAG: transposase [Desulfobacteraceae bacterium]|nr:transposase [Desulfobacteraceae bacterium]
MVYSLTVNRLRTHRCSFCTVVANRDYSAAINILRIGR